MALFKIEKGSSVNLKSNRQNTNEGYCYFTTDEGKMYIDIKTGINTSNDPSFRVALNAEKADKLNNVNTTENIPVYFKDGLPVEVTKNYLELDSTNKALIEDVYFTNIHGNLNGNATSASKLNLTEDVGAVNVPVYFQDGIPVPCNELKTETLTINVNGSEAGRFDGSEPVSINIETQAGNFLPLTAGEDHKISGPLGFTNVSYGSVLPTTGFEGQLFFLEEEVNGGPPIYVPEGGNIGTVLTKNSDEDGDVSWKDIVALPKGGNPGQVLVKNTTADGDASWAQADYLPLTGGTITGGLILNSQNYVDPVGQNFAIAIEGSDSAASGVVVKNSTRGVILFVTPDGSVGLTDLTSDPIVYKSPQGNYHLGPSGVYSNGTVLYGAAWNDYAEYRSQKETIEPGYCVASADNGQVYKTSEKFQACDGIVSDTFGFAIGETDECKTPLAVAGRVLAYCEGNRQDYHSGDTVCAGPDGKVCKMTREEIREWPDRIIGIVSEIPEYEIWGDGNVPVNGRIWIKIK